MSQTLIQKDMTRFNRAVGRKSVYTTTCQEIMAYACPERDTFYEHAEGQKKDNGNLVFDSTAVNGLLKFASNIQSSLVPPMKRWVKLEVGMGVAEDLKKSAGEALQTVTELMFAYLQMSNFDTAIGECFQDLAIGTACLIVQRGTKENPFRFVPVPIPQAFFEEGGDGRVGTKFRKWQCTGSGIKDIWPDANIPEEFKRKIDNSPQKKFNIIEITEPVKRTVKGEKVQMYSYRVIAEGCDEYLVKDVMRSDPWIVFRWSVIPGEVYGRGPLMMALPDIKTLNKTKEFTLKAAGMGIAGAWTVVDDGVINVNTVEIYPGAKIPVASNEGGTMGPTIRRLDTGGDINLSQLVIADLRQSVNDIMFAEPLGPIDLPVKSATEVSLRSQELAKRIGSAYGRLQYELIIPLVNRLLHIMEELDLVDVDGYRVDGSAIAVRAVSPLAMAQDEEDLMAMMRYTQHISAVYGPEAAAILTKPEVYVSILAEKTSVDKRIVPTEAEFQQMRARLAGVAAAAQQQGKVA